MMKVGAYKADFFRYCVLTIEGGIYADMDVMLQSDIELLLEPHLTFFAPVDSPGEKIGRQPCLWNGLMGATRAHPIVVRALEQALTGILSRSTIVEIERDRLCPGVKDLTSLTRHYDTLFLSGPCNLGVAANEVIGTGREALSGFEVGLSELKLEVRLRLERQRVPRSIATAVATENLHVNISYIISSYNAEGAILSNT